MAKKTFTDEDQAFLRQLIGKQGFGLTTAALVAHTDIFEGELRLLPTMYRIRDEFFVWNDLSRRRFYNLDARSYKNGEWGVYYFPEDCGVATGSSAHNWTQWSSVLFGYGRGEHQFAPKLPVADVRVLLERRGHELSSWSRARFLTSEMVTFYLCRQQRTWAHPGAIQGVRRRLCKFDEHYLIPSLPQFANRVERPHEAEDVNGLVDSLGTVPAEDDTVPAEDDTVPAEDDTIPAEDDTIPAEDDTTPDTPAPEDTPMPTPTTPMPSPAVAPEPIPTTSLRTVDKFEGMPTDHLEAEIAAMQATLAQRCLAESRAAREEHARGMEVLGGDVYSDRAYFRTVEVRYPDGSIRTLYDQEALPSGERIQAVKKKK